MIDCDEKMWELREAHPGSKEYRRFLGLRFEELRKPLGLEWTREELENDEKDRHFGFYVGGDLVGTLVVRELGGRVAKVRQVAVTGTRQGEGLGLRLMTTVEGFLAKEGVEACELNARLTVAGFYEKTGYERIGGIFDEIGIPHVKMQKQIRQGG